MITCRYCGQPKESATNSCARRFDFEESVHEWVNEAGELVKLVESKHEHD